MQNLNDLNNNQVKTATSLTWDDVVKLNDSSNIDLIGYSNGIDVSDMPYIHTINVKGATLAEIKTQLTILFVDHKENIQLLTNDEFLNLREKKFKHDYKIDQVQEISRSDYSSAFDCFFPQCWFNDSGIEIFRFLESIDETHSSFFINKNINGVNRFFKIATRKNIPYTELLQMIDNNEALKVA